MLSSIQVCGREMKIEGRLVRVARFDGDKFISADDPEAVVRGLKECGQRVDVFTFLQQIPETSPKYSYPMEWDNLAVLPVSTYENWWTQQIGRKVRNMVKHAEKKNVQLREVPFNDALLEGICEIYNESPVRQGRRFTHYGMNLEDVRTHAGTYLDCSLFLGAFFEDRMIGFIKLIIDEAQTQAHVVHILSMLRHRDKGSTNALIAQAVRSCADRGISYLVYDKFAYGKKEASGLIDFKEYNGFKKVDLPRYYIPITRLGQAGIRLGLHNRKFVDYLPNRLTDSLRDFRTAWYRRKFLSPGGAS